MSNKAFFRPSVTVDVVVFTIEDNMLKVLTIRRANAPFKGSSALPGGFILSGETTLDAAKRVLKDKVGLKDIFLEQLYTFDSQKRDPRGDVISVAYFALAPRENLSMNTSSTTQEPTFLPVKNMGEIAFDHNKIIRYAHERLKGRMEYTNIAFSILPKEFTFSELQNVYEVIFGKVFDKRNFRKKISRLELIKATRKKVKRGRQRPALLYTPSTQNPQTFKNVF